MRGLHADSVYVTILLVIALAIAAVWSSRDGRGVADCEPECETAALSHVDTP